MSASEKLFEKSKEFIPGGVNSPVRAFKAVGGVPPFIVRASWRQEFMTKRKKSISITSALGGR